MNISMKTLGLALAAMSVAPASQAAEGMWMPKQLPAIASALKAEGLAIEPTRLSQLTEFPMAAIVSLGGCSASFVSPQGLVVTNHHCAYGSIQFNSNAQRDLIKKGFLAANPAEELPAAPGSRVFVTVDVQDVTSRVLDAATARLNGKQRSEAMERNEKRIVAECEKDAGHRCSVARFYGGLEFQLIKRMEIRDVRLAYAPPSGVGKFGGDTDNWMWPRHTGDFSFYRAYVGADGKPADYSPTNKPYEPKHFLKLASEGLKEGDFVMVTGYPGRTDRHRLPSEMDFAFNWQLPANRKAIGEWLAIVQRETQGRKDAEIRMASDVASRNNVFKNLGGKLESFAGSDMLARKQASLDELKTWIAADAKRRQLYQADVLKAEQLLKQRDAIAKREFLLNYATPRLLGTARLLQKMAIENAKPDAERQAGYQARDQRSLRQALETLDRRYDEQVDKALVQHYLAQYLALPAEEQSAAFLNALGLKRGMDGAALRARLDALYASSQLADATQRKAWLDRDAAAFKASPDGFIAAAAALYADDEARENRDKELAGDIQKSYASYMAALIAFKSGKGETVYPDANSTLRISFGKVAGRTPGSDGSNWTAFTTVRGVSAKNTGSGDFDAPADQIAAIQAHKFDRYVAPELKTVPVDFLARLDITGGNSGSAILNKNAELVGLAFDSTLDAVINDWDFNLERTRTIGVDLRYMLWQMKVVDHADALLKEMKAP